MALEEPYDIITRWLEANGCSLRPILLIQNRFFTRLPADGSISAKNCKAANVDISGLLVHSVLLL